MSILCCTSIHYYNLQGHQTVNMFIRTRIICWHSHSYRYVHSISGDVLDICFVLIGLLMKLFEPGRAKKHVLAPKRNKNPPPTVYLAIIIVTYYR